MRSGLAALALALALAHTHILSFSLFPWLLKGLWNRAYGTRACQVFCSCTWGACELVSTLAESCLLTCAPILPIRGIWRSALVTERNPKSTRGLDFGVLEWPELNADVFVCVTLLNCMIAGKKPFLTQSSLSSPFLIIILNVEECWRNEVMVWAQTSSPYFHDPQSVLESPSNFLVVDVTCTEICLFICDVKNLLKNQKSCVRYVCSTMACTTCYPVIGIYFYARITPWIQHDLFWNKVIDEGRMCPR